MFIVQLCIHPTIPRACSVVQTHRTLYTGHVLDIIVVNVHTIDIIAVRVATSCSK